MRRLRQEEDYWNEYKDYNLESSSDESNCNKPSLDELSSDKEKKEMIRDNEREKITHKGLGDDEGGVQLEIEKRNFKPRWRSDAGGYLQGDRGCSLSTTEKREKRRKKELEKSVSHTQSIGDMFLAKYNYNRLHYSASPPNLSSLSISSQMSSIGLT